MLRYVARAAMGIPEEDDLQKTKNPNLPPRFGSWEEYGEARGVYVYEGQWAVRCLDCGEVWRLRWTRSGHLFRGAHLCPNECHGRARRPTERQEEARAERAYRFRAKVASSGKYEEFFRVIEDVEQYADPLGMLVRDERRNGLPWYEEFPTNGQVR